MFDCTRITAGLLRGVKEHLKKLGENGPIGKETDRTDVETSRFLTAVLPNIAVVFQCRLDAGFATKRAVL